jgi:chemotaxis signal transduction protein
MQHYLSCRIGREWYGIELAAVIEVLHFVALTELPGTPPEVLGLMTIRDLVMPVVDLRRLFGLPEAALTLDTPIVAVRAPEGAVGLVVDDTDNIENIQDEQVAVYDGVASPYVSGAIRLSEGLLMLLNLSALKLEKSST